MSARAVLVTGPTRGLGREVVSQLVDRRLCDVLLLVGRPGPALEETRQAAAAGGGIEVISVAADLSSMDEVRAAARSVVEELDRRDRKLDVVALNAALQFDNATTTTVDGFEATFAIGLLANHALLDALRSHLDSAAHVVVVGSGTHYGDFPATLLVPGPKWRPSTELARPWTDENASTPRAGRRAYSTMKLGVNYLATGWKQRLGTVRVNVYDPGLMPGTGLVRTGGWQQVVWNRVMPALTILPGVTTPQRSSRCFADLLVGETFPTLDGGYVEIGRIKAASAESNNSARVEELMKTCDELSRA